MKDSTLAESRSADPLIASNSNPHNSSLSVADAKGINQSNASTNGASAAADAKLTTAARARSGTGGSFDDNDGQMGSIPQTNASGATLLSVLNTPDFMQLPLELQG